MAETYKIGEAAKLLNLKTYVLRFWETEFPQITPLRTDKGQRLYSHENIELLKRVQYLLHDRGLTIEGARRILKEERQKGTASGKADRFSVPMAPEAPSLPEPVLPSQAQVLASDQTNIKASDQINTQANAQANAGAGHGESSHAEKNLHAREVSSAPPPSGVAYQEIIQELEEVAALLRSNSIIGDIKK